MQAISICCLLLLASAYFFADAEAADGIHNFGIVNGEPVNITQMPFMAIFRPKNESWGCGASIINEQFLITAGHCLTDLSAESSRITVGTDTINGGIDYEVEKAIRHPKYFCCIIFDYDLAIIKLKKKLTFSDRVKPIEIADSILPKPGEMLESIGFGDMGNKKPSKILLKANLPYVDKETCEKLNAPAVVTDRYICAGGDGDKATCHGDSGGPLIYKGRLIGAISRLFSKQCASKGHPGGFSYIPSMKDFVDDGDSGGPLIYKGTLIGAVSRGFSTKCASKGHPGGFSYVPSMRDFVDDVMKNDS